MHRQRIWSGASPGTRIPRMLSARIDTRMAHRCCKLCCLLNSAGLPMDCRSPGSVVRSLRLSLAKNLLSVELESSSEHSPLPPQGKDQKARRSFIGSWTQPRANRSKYSNIEHAKVESPPNPAIPGSSESPQRVEARSAGSALDLRSCGAIWKP